MSSSRNTSSKMAILEMLRSAEEALSHKEIMTQLDGMCDRVTVYRVLDRLIDEGHLHRVVDLDGVKRFAACQDCGANHHHHNHVHFSCTRCEKVTCLDKIQPSVKLPAGFVVNESVYTLSGLCPECS